MDNKLLKINSSVVKLRNWTLDSPISIPYERVSEICLKV